MNMIDCASTITQQIASNLSRNNVSHVGRYLSTGWKGLTISESQVIKQAGLNIVSIYETNPTYAGYFTYDKGVEDAKAAKQLAQKLEQPTGSAIYFTVDYDAQTKDFARILNYFQGLKDTLKNYKVGAYGKFEVIVLLQTKKLADYFYQTYAWSSGQHAKNVHLFQYKNDIKQYELNCDLNQIENVNCGSWGQQKTVSHQVVKTLGKVKVTTKTLNLRDKPSTNGKIIRVLNHGESYIYYAISNGWYDLGRGQWAYGGNGYLAEYKEQTTQSYTIRKNDTLTKIALIFKTNVANLMKLNPNISNPNKIYEGQSIIVPKN